MAFGFQNLAKIPELRKRLLFTLALPRSKTSARAACHGLRGAGPIAREATASVATRSARPALRVRSMRWFLLHPRLATARRAVISRRPAGPQAGAQAGETGALFIFMEWPAPPRRPA